ncbi:MAG: hypothetical protein ACWGQW_00345 [bacterium]
MSLIQRARRLTHVGNLLHDVNSGLRARELRTSYAPDELEALMYHDIQSPSYHPDKVGLHDDDPPSDTDYTTEAASSDSNDVPCMPSSGAVADGLYIGDAAKFNTIRARVDTVGVGTYEYTLKYWNGETWFIISSYFAQGDEINDFKSSGHNGWCWSSFTMPGDWALYTLMSSNLYWVKFEVTSFTSCSQIPLLGQIYIGDLWT